MNEDRFTGKASDYGKYRPSYPKEIIFLLQKECNLTAKSTVADVGAGTGIFTSLLAPYCGHIFAVEPNADMAINFKYSDNITLVAATAEKTLLDNDSVDIITAAQAFHWFNKEPTLTEFKRILKENCYVVLIWNNRNRNTPFERAYERICDRYRDNYLQANDQRYLEKDKAAFYKNGEFKKFFFSNEQELNFEEACGRLLSLSYMPKQQDEEFLKVQADMGSLFELYSTNGKVRLTMRTEIYIGKIH